MSALNCSMGSEIPYTIPTVHESATLPNQQKNSRRRDLLGRGEEGRGEGYLLSRKFLPILLIILSNTDQTLPSEFGNCDSAVARDVPVYIAIRVCLLS